jgi:DNA-binding LacI/PurR family transcriptional regulator
MAGVSVKTASNVVNGLAFVKPENVRRVTEAIRALGYQPNMAARNLRTGRTGVICLAVPQLAFNYFGELAEAVMAAAQARGQKVLIELTGGDREHELELLKRPQLSLFDGVLFSPLGMSQEDADQLQTDYPLVLLGERILMGPADHVLMENIGGAKRATEHLIQTGHRRIAVIGARSHDIVGSGPLRVSGYKEALAQAGLPFDEALIVEQDDWHRMGGYVATMELIGRQIEFDAIFALNDELALGALRALYQEQLAVPDAVALVGFDNLVDSQFSMPGLTTVDPCRADIAETALKTLLERICDRRKKKIGPARTIRVSSNLVVRESAPGPNH